MRTCICAIAKSENQYLREWVEHYYNLGFTHIILYDNNDINSERFEDVISDYILNGFVSVIDVRGISQWYFQYRVYEECYNRLKDEYDWFAFFDLDELLFLNQDTNISDYLNRPCFDGFNIVHINWKMYDDNGLVKNDGRPVKERFTHPADINVKLSAEDKDLLENDCIKSIVRGHLPYNIEFKATTHSPSNVDLCCNNRGDVISDPKLHHNPYNYDFAELRHYAMKTITEYIQKRKRGYPDQPLWRAQSLMTIEKFFKLNEWTKEKQAVIDESRI